MVAKCKMFMNCSKNIIANCKMQLPKREYLGDHRYERTNMGYKCKIFETVNIRLGGILDMSIVSKVIGVNTENEICLPNK